MPPAGRAAADLNIEQKGARLVAGRSELRQVGEPVADRGEGADVGGRVGARRATDRRLVDVDYLVDVLDPLDGVVGAGKGARLVQAAGQRLVERLDDERRLAAAGDAGDAGEGAERNQIGRAHV